jgi:hypothetical protein
MRLHNENCTGQLHINGAPITQQQLANSSVYVPQVRCRDAHMFTAADNWQLRTAAVGPATDTAMPLQALPASSQCLLCFRCCLASPACFSCLLLLQFDSLVPVMTARESVEFAAAVRLPRGTPRDVQAARVDVVLQLMGLSEQQHMLVSFMPCYM